MVRNLISTVVLSGLIFTLSACGDGSSSGHSHHKGGGIFDKPLPTPEPTPQPNQPPVANPTPTPAPTETFTDLYTGAVVSIDDLDNNFKSGRQLLDTILPQGTYLGKLADGRTCTVVSSYVTNAGVTDLSVKMTIKNPASSFYIMFEASNVKTSGMGSVNVTPTGATAINELSAYYLQKNQDGQMEPYAQATMKIITQGSQALSIWMFNLMNEGDGVPAQAKCVLN